MKEKLQKFALYILIGVFLLGYVMMDAGWENDNSLFSTIGIIMIVVVAIFIGISYVSDGSKERKIAKQYQRELEAFKQKARKIRVNLEEVEIKTNQWTDIIMTDNSEYAGLDDLAGYHESNIMKIDRNLNSVRITIPNHGNPIGYLVNIDMDPTTLSIHFAIKKETTLYIDGNELYLDLEFLE